MWGVFIIHIILKIYSFSIKIWILAYIFAMYRIIKSIKIFYKYFKGKNIATEINDIYNSDYTTYFKVPIKTVKNLMYIQEEIFTGRLVEYYDEKNIHRELNYNKGKLHGQQIAYYSNGKIKVRTIYEKGINLGPFEYYGENGVKLYAILYKDEVPYLVNNDFDMPLYYVKEKIVNFYSENLYEKYYENDVKKVFLNKDKDRNLLNFIIKLDNDDTFDIYLNSVKKYFYFGKDSFVASEDDISIFYTIMVTMIIIIVMISLCFYF